MYSDYSFCQAVKFGTQKGGSPLPVGLAYDIGCNWCIHFLERVRENPTLDFDETTNLVVSVGKWHLAGHVEGCFNRYSLNFVKGAGRIDGEIMERIWSQLNRPAITARSMTDGHRRAALNTQIADINFKKMISMGKLPYSFISLQTADVSLLFQIQLFMKSFRQQRQDSERLLRNIRSILNMWGHPR